MRIAARIGIMGGTFDPIHNGHLVVARAALRLGLERVALVPARLPPHKDREDIADPFHRFAMIALAAAEDDGLRVSACEVARQGPSYTIETVRRFIASGMDVTLIMGSDSLAEIETWRECRELLDLADVIVYPRAPIVAPELWRRLPGWVNEKLNAGSIRYVDAPVDRTSSTEVRRLLRQGLPAAGLLPAAVSRYIVRHRLYVEGTEGRI